MRTALPPSLPPFLPPADPTILLSILCQGRNDNYMGNFLYRLATALNIHARNLRVLGVTAEVEILVADWGSEVPLREVLDLSEDARRLVRFLQVPPALARHYDRDSTFSGVHPTNAIARRARGRYLLFADSDVIVPLASLAQLLHFLRRGAIGTRTLDDHFFWASKLHIPADLVATEPSLEALEEHIALNWPSYIYERIDKHEFGGGGVCLLMPRAVWWESRGWDERLIYWGWYDIDWHRRLKKRYQWDLLEEHGIRVFHLEHYQTRFKEGAREAHNRQQPNPQSEPESYTPNPESWGLGEHEIPWWDGFGHKLISPDQVSEERSADGTVNVRDLLASEPRHWKPPNDEAIATSPIRLTPILRKIVSQKAPRRAAIITEGNTGDAGMELALLPGVDAITWVDTWREENLPEEARAAIPPRQRGRLFERFLAHVDDAGCAARIFPIRARADEAARDLSERGASFDLVFFASSSDLEGSRRDVLRWMPLLAEGGILYVVGGHFHCTLNTCGPALHALAKEQDLYFIEVPSLTLVLPRSLCEAIAPELEVIVKGALTAAARTKVPPYAPTSYLEYLRRARN